MYSFFLYIMFIDQILNEMIRKQLNMDNNNINNLSMKLTHLKNRGIFAHFYPTNSFHQSQKAFIFL